MSMLTYFGFRSKPQLETYIMPIVDVLDGAGNVLSYLEIDGLLFPACISEDNVRKIPDFKIRDDDVFICGYMRSGTHWLWEMVTMLVNGKAETVQMEKEALMLEFTDHASIDCLPSPRVLNAHVNYERLPSGVKKRKLKIVLLIRDPRDVAVSWYNVYLDYRLENKYTGEWKDWFPLFMEGKVDWGSWFDHIRDWEKALDGNEDNEFFIVHYEDVHENPIKILNQLSNFLGLAKNDELIRRIKEKCEFTNMKAAKEDITARPQGKMVHYRKGKSGDWKNWFTVAQSETFNKVYEEMMPGSRFYKKYSTVKFS